MPDEDRLKPWDPADCIEQLKSETVMLDDGDERQTAERIYKQGAPIAAASIVHLAQHAASEHTRLHAAKYVTDRVLGGVISSDGNVDKDPFKDFLKRVEAVANGAES